MAEFNFSDDQWYSFICGFNAGLRLKDLNAPPFESGTLLTPLVPGGPNQAELAISISKDIWGKAIVTDNKVDFSLWETVEVDIPVFVYGLYGNDIDFSSFVVNILMNSEYIEFLGLKEADYGPIQDMENLPSIIPEGSITHWYDTRGRLHVEGRYNPTTKFEEPMILFYMHLRIIKRPLIDDPLGLTFTNASLVVSGKLTALYRWVDKGGILPVETKINPLLYMTFLEKVVEYIEGVEVEEPPQNDLPVAQPGVSIKGSSLIKLNNSKTEVGKVAFMSILATCTQTYGKMREIYVTLVSGDMKGLDSNGNMVNGLVDIDTIEVDAASDWDIEYDIKRSHSMVPGTHGFSIIIKGKYKHDDYKLQSTLAFVKFRIAKTLEDGITPSSSQYYIDVNTTSTRMGAIQFSSGELKILNCPGSGGKIWYKPDSIDTSVPPDFEGVPEISYGDDVYENEWPPVEEEDAPFLPTEEPKLTGGGRIWSDTEKDIDIDIGNGIRIKIHLIPGWNDVTFDIPLISGEDFSGNLDFNLKFPGIVILDWGFNWNASSSELAPDLPLTPSFIDNLRFSDIWSIDFDTTSVEDIDNIDEINIVDIHAIDIEEEGIFINDTIDNINIVDTQNIDMHKRLTIVNNAIDNIDINDTHDIFLGEEGVYKENIIEDISIVDISNIETKYINKVTEDQQDNINMTDIYNIDIE